MPVIDADAHVFQTDRTWEYLEGPERNLAPVLVNAPGRPPEQGYWLIDGSVRSRGANVIEVFPRESRELIDVNARLAHMDQMSIDVQVLYPSILQSYTPRAEVELAFCRTYNRWLGDV